MCRNLLCSLLCFDKCFWQITTNHRNAAIPWHWSSIEKWLVFAEDFMCELVPAVFPENTLRRYCMKQTDLKKWRKREGRERKGRYILEKLSPTPILAKLPVGVREFTVQLQQTQNGYHISKSELGGLHEGLRMKFTLWGSWTRHFWSGGPELYSMLITNNVFWSRLHQRSKNGIVTANLFRGKVKHCE